jgi:hypothetical protein
VEAKHVPPLETLLKNIVCLALATRSGGTPPLAAIVRHPAENFIRNHFHIRFQHKLEIPRPSTPIQACNASTLPMQGKGGSYSNSRDARVAPLPLHPIPPRRRFSQTG